MVQNELVQNNVLTVSLNQKMSLSSASEFRNMAVWEGGYNLCLEICRAADSSDKESNALMQQLKSTAADIPLNLSKSGSYKLGKQYIRFLRSAFVSSKQLGTLLLLCQDLSYIQTDKFMELNAKANEYSTKLIKYIRFCERKLRMKRYGKN